MLQDWTRNLPPAPKMPLAVARIAASREVF
jgi:hypothetical protein